MTARSLLCLVALLAVACGDDGDDGDDTKFGDADDVLAYRSALYPITVEVSAVEAEIRSVLDDSLVAVDADLAPLYRQLRPRLQAVRDSLEVIRPPRKLRQLHAQIVDMVQLRIDAFGLVIQGFDTGDIALYDTAVEQIRQANELTGLINERLREVDDALLEHDDGRLLAGVTCPTQRLAPA